MKRRVPLELPPGPPITDPAQPIAAVRAAYPQLGRFGMLVRQGAHEICVECVVTAMAVLSQCHRVKTPRLNSYWLKHCAENFGRHNGGESYVANGDLIIAALALRIPVTWNGVSPNVAVGVCGDDAEQLDPEWQAQQRRWSCPTLH